MDKQKTVLAVVGVLLLAGAVHGATLTVRRDGTGRFTRIQPAVDAAAPGDTIDIGPGDYQEFQTIRPPLWDWDVVIYVYITTDDLTLVGAGSDETVIGPPEPWIDYQHFTPIGIWAGNEERLKVRELAVRHCYTGVYGPWTALDVERVFCDRVNIGLFVLSETVEVDDCSFLGIGNAPNAVGHMSYCSYSRIRNCEMRGCGVYIEAVEDYVVADCTFTDGLGGVGIHGGSLGVIERCTVNSAFNVGFDVAYGRCTMSDVEIFGGGFSGIWVQEGGELFASRLTIRDTTRDCFRLASPVSVEVHESNILPETGYAIWFESGSQPPHMTFDFTGNWWGVADSTAIAELIWDANDSPWAGDYADFVPFQTQPAVQKSPLGSVKAMFR